MSSQQEEIERIARALSQSIRYSCGKGQYDTLPDLQDAYIDGVETAIAMMYIDLTGTPKSKGILASLTEAHKVEMEKMVSEMLHIQYGKDATTNPSVRTAQNNLIANIFRELRVVAKKFNIEVK